MNTIVKNVIQSFADKFPHLQEAISSLILHISNKCQDENYVIHCIQELEYFFKVGKLTIIDVKDEESIKNNFMSFEIPIIEVAMFMKELSGEQMEDLITWLHERREAGANAKNILPIQDKNLWLLYSSFYNPNLFAFKHLNLFCH